MTIDPRVYRQYGGRSGDPMDRLGEALAQSSATRQANAELRDRSFAQSLTAGHRTLRLIFALTAAVIVAVAVWMAVF